MKYYAKLVFAILGRFKGIIFISILFGILIFFVLRIASSYFFRGNKERIGVTGRYYTTELPNFILEMISDGLTVLGDDLSPQPSIASSWETPDGGKTWIFNIKNEMLWQDDTIITSNNINLDFGDVEIETPDESKISFKLQNPYAPFPAFVSRPIFKKGLIGTGKWKVNKISVIGSYVKEVSLENNKGDKKTYKFYPTTDRTKLAYKLGEVDKIVNLLNPSPFDDWKTSDVETYSNKNQVVTMFFNTQDVVLGDKSVRQALTYSINKKRWGTRAISPIPPDSWSYNSRVKEYLYNFDKAKKTIDELSKEQKENLEIKLISSPALLDVAEDISKDWEKLGIRTQILISSIIPDEFQAYLTIFDIPPDPDQYSIWHSTQLVNNISNYKSPRIDKLLEDGRATLDLEERRKIYLDFQRFLLEDLPAAFLYYPDYFNVSRK